MFICLVTQAFPSLTSLTRKHRVFPGIERVAYGLARGLRQTGAHVRVIAVQRKGEAGHETVDGLEIFRLKDSNFFLGRIGSLFSGDLLSFSHSIINNAHLLNHADLALFNLPFPFFRQLSRKAKPSMTAVIFHHREPWLTVSKLLTSPIADACVRRTEADYVIVPSRYSASIFSGFISKPDRIRIIPWGVDHTVFKPHAGSSVAEGQVGHRKELLYVGTAEPRKNLGVLLGSVSRILRNSPTIRLLVVGPGHSRTKEFAKRLCLDDRIIVCGAVPHHVLPRYYANAHVYVSASTIEGFGFTFLEAMACGKPVVAFNAASIPEVVGDGGILIQPHDSRGMSDAIERILADDNLYSKLSTKALARASQFSWENTAREVIEMVEAT